MNLYLLFALLVYFFSLFCTSELSVESAELSLIIGLLLFIDICVVVTLSLMLISDSKPRVLFSLYYRNCVTCFRVQSAPVPSTLCPKKSDAKIQITITTAYLIRIKYLLSGFNYHLSDANFANFNKIHRIVSEHQLINKWYSKTEVSNMEKSP